jgi:hypothetical protein
VWGARRHAYSVLVEKPERDHLEDLGVDGSIIFKWIFKKGDGSMDWIDLAQNWDRWQTFVNAVVNLGFNKMQEIS